MKYLLLLLALILGIGNLCVAQVNISVGSSVSQAFALGTSATAVLPAGWKADKNTTVRLVGSYSTAVSATELVSGNTMSGTAGNGIYNYGAGVAGTATDRAVGGISSTSASKSVNVYLQLANNGTSSITSLTISYDVEKYRNGSNAAGFSIQMYYSTNGTSWTSAGSDFLTSFAADADNSGYTSAPGTTVAITSKILTQTIAASGNLYLAWNYSVTSGTTTSNAQALGIDNVTISAVGLPADPTAVTATAASPSQIDLGFTPNGAGNNVIIAWNTVNTFGTPVAGTPYAANDAIAGGGTVLYNGLTSPFNHSSLSANTQYFYKIWSVNALNVYSTGVEFNATTLKSAPLTQASLINFPAASVGNTSMLVQWTNGDGDKRVVIANTTNTFTAPAEGTDPTANSVYTSGQKVVYNGTGSSFSVTGLNANTTYWFKVFEYNNSGLQTKYCSGTGTDNPLSQLTSPNPTTPLVESPTYASVTNTTAVLGGNVTSAGNVVGGLLERGTVWNTTGSVTISDNKGVESSPISGVFTHLRSGLPAKTQIYFKAFATNILGTTLTSEGTFFTLATEPSAYPGSFSALTSGSFSIDLSWTAAAGADGYLIFRKSGATAPTGMPSDATAYNLNNLVGDGTLVADVLSGTTTSQTITGLSALTQYTFIIVPYSYDGLNYQTYNYKTDGTAPSATAITNPPSYTWIGLTGGDWSLASNWSPARATKTVNDILIFNDGSTVTVSQVSTETIAQLRVQNNTAVTLTSAAVATLTITGYSNDFYSVIDLFVASGSQFIFSGSSAITLSIPTGASACVYGAMKFIGGAHKISAVPANPVIFVAGSSFTAGLTFTGNPFGTTSLNSVIFQSGATYIQQAGSNPFGAGAPNSVVVFQPGSSYRLDINAAPATSGRTYPNFEYNNAGSVTITGTSAATFDNFTVTQGTFNFNMTATPGHSIKGNISVASGATLNFNPAVAGTIQLNSSSQQTISGSGTLTISSLATFDINNANGILLNRSLTVNGKINLTNGLVTLGNNNLLLTSSGSITGTPSATKMIVATGVGQLRKEFASGYTGSYVFPVGDNSGSAGYSPVTLNFSAATFGTGNYVGVNLVNLKYPGDFNTGSFLNRYWTITQNAVSAFTCNADFQYEVTDITGNENEIYCIKMAPAPVQMYGIANTVLHQISATGLTSFSTFAGTQTDPVPYLVSGDGSYCQNTGGLTVTLSNSQPGVSYQLKKNTIIDGVPIPGTGSALTWTGKLAGTYTVSAYNSVATVAMTGSAVIAEIPSAPVSVSIAADANNVCDGTSVTITATPVNGGTPVYAWFKNTLPAGLNQNTYTYTPANGDQIYVVLTSNVNCGINSPATSATLSMNVIPLPVPVITGLTSVCNTTSGVVYSTASGKTNYVWSISAGGTITAGSGTNSITVTWNTAGSQSLSVNYTDNTCNAATATAYPVTVKPLPVVSIPSVLPEIHLQDPPISLTGGLPLGGTYSGAGVVNGFFDPTLVGNGSFAITYTYTDNLGCSNSAVGYIHVLDPGTFAYTVGAGGFFPNLTGLTGAFNYLNTTTRFGNVNLYIMSDLTEPGTIPLMQSTEVLPGGFTITIKPNDVTEKVISGNVSQAMIRLDGADRVFFEGSIVFPTKSIRFINTNSSFPAILLKNGATNNTFHGCIIEGSNSTLNSGLILLGTTTSTGNSSNTFNTNIFRNDAANPVLPANLFYSEGSSSAPNSSIVLQSNEFVNFSQNGISVTSTGNGNTWSINGNSFYYNLPNPAIGNQTSINFIPGSSSSGNYISNNYIGGSTYQIYGSQWLNEGNIAFKGIVVNSNSSTISHNTIGNIKLNSTLTPSFKGIEIISGAATIDQSNIIGSLNISNSIQIAGSGTIMGIVSGSAGLVTINSNKIANISSIAPAGSPTLSCFYLTNGSMEKNLAYNIGSSTSNQTPVIYGIVNSASGLSYNLIMNNMINLKGGNASNPKIYGIFDQSASGSGGGNYRCNTVNISGTTTASATNSTFAFYRQGTASVFLYNNILSNQRSSLTLSKSYAVYSVSNLNWTSNFNDLKTISPTLGYWNASVRVDLAAWKTATANDANSISVTPVFVSATDLHLTSSNTGIFHKGSFLYAPLTDYDNQPRHPFTPDPGADEYISVPAMLEADNEEIKSLAVEMHLFPNPSSDAANILLDLPEASTATIQIYNITGLLIEKYTNMELTAGQTTINLNCSDFAPGIYFVKLSTSTNAVLVKRLEVIH